MPRYGDLVEEAVAGIFNGDGGWGAAVLVLVCVEAALPVLLFELLFPAPALPSAVFRFPSPVPRLRSSVAPMPTRARSSTAIAMTPPVSARFVEGDCGAPSRETRVGVRKCGVVREPCPGISS